jgi:RNA polymerase sigma-70 factor (ECF subfamily)
LNLADRIVELLPRLRRFALTLTRREEDADDLVQGAVERALARLDSWRPDTRLDSWLFKIMQNLWIDQVRARRTRGTQTTDAELADLAGGDSRDVLDARLTLRDTLQATLDLPEEQRATLLLVVVEGFSYRDAAEVLGVPVGTVMSRLSRARAALEGRVFGDEPPALSVVRQ